MVGMNMKHLPRPDYVDGFGRLPPARDPWRGMASLASPRTVSKHARQPPPEGHNVEKTDLVSQKTTEQLERADASACRSNTYRRAAHDARVWPG